MSSKRSPEGTAMQVLIDDLIEAARLLGATQAKKGIGYYTPEDARFERAMHESISDKAKRLTAERDELRRQLAEAEMDAERYRWLRNEANTARKCDPMVCIYPLDEQDLIDGDRLDVAIDAAMGLTRPAEES